MLLQCSFLHEYKTHVFLHAYKRYKGMTKLPVTKRHQTEIYFREFASYIPIFEADTIVLPWRNHERTI